MMNLLSSLQVNFPRKAILLAGLLTLLLVTTFSTPVRAAGCPSSASCGQALPVGGGEELTKADVQALATDTSPCPANAPASTTLPVEPGKPNEPQKKNGVPKGPISPKGNEGGDGLAQSVEPTTSWIASGTRALDPPDPQIAVSSTHVIITDQNIAFYNKAGQLLWGPVQPCLFFEKLKGDEQPTPTLAISDTRVMFDEYRKRFWIADLSNNPYCGFQPCRRSRLVVAVSKDENPFDGWFLYFWDGVVDQGKCSHPGGCAGTPDLPGDDMDYPLLGVDSCCLYVTNRVARNWTDILGGQHTYERYWQVALLSADPMAKGDSSATVPAWVWWDLTAPDGKEILIQPVVAHGPSPRGYLVGSWYDQDGSSHILVWGMEHPVGWTTATANAIALDWERDWADVRPFVAPVVAPQPGTCGNIETTNGWVNVLKAIYRNQHLYVTNHETANWTTGVNQTSIRVVRLDLSDWTSDRAFVHFPQGNDDRTFGDLAQGDPPAEQAYYMWPALEVNKQGNMVVVYTRSSTDLYPQVRYSTFLYPTEPDIRPSQLLKAGEGYAGSVPTDCSTATPYRWGDLAGASVDPYDDTGVWIAHEYANAAHETDVWVGKVFGAQHPDLWLRNFSVGLPSDQTKIPVPLSAKVTLSNEGDGAATQIALTIAMKPTSGGIAKTLLTFPEGDLPAGYKKDFELQVPHIPTGYYDFIVSAYGQTCGSGGCRRQAEYTLSNNSLTKRIYISGGLGTGAQIQPLPSLFEVTGINSLPAAPATEAGGGNE
ncbi:MAG: hypothetical protein WCF84_09555 [Anaerolineae bacterium]